ncbi:hypothetical protein [Adonisia turfae]|uniref:hypothetical protein n=1 Tax=Adonisia turfae TaxID=2950184 RepID=UPI0013D6A890|nr:hypothetical protein [Adonisia turfae]
MSACHAEVVGDGSSKELRYSQRQLLFLARKTAGYKVPPNTLRSWRNRLGVRMGNDKCYGEAEVRYVLDFLAFRTHGYTMQQYIDYKHGQFSPAMVS